MPSNLIRRADYDPQTRKLSIWLVTTQNRYDYEKRPARDIRGFPTRLL